MYREGLTNLILSEVLRKRMSEYGTELKGTIFWDITPCSSLSVNRLF
jgi:hypothetical protein